MTTSSAFVRVRGLILLVVVAVLAACGGGEHNAKSAAEGRYAGAPPSPDAASASGTAAAAEKTWKRSQIVPNSSRLMVGDKESLPLRALQAKVTIDGFRARVVLDYLYENDRDRQYEGTFQLRLPDEASPYFFAFGENVEPPAAPLAKDPPPAEAQTPKGTTQLFMAVSETRKSAVEPVEIMAQRAPLWRGPKEARVVPKEKAAYAYGEVVRQRVDPALMEWEGGGVFNARVFPLAAKKTHRVVVAYDMDLVRIGDDLEYRMDLPDKVPQFAVDLSVASAQGVTVAASPEQKPVTAEGRAHFRYEDPKERTLTLRVKKAPAIALVGSDAKIGDFFASSFKPDLGADKPVKGEGRAVFLVDTSLSSNPDRYNVWLKLLSGVLEKNRDSMKKFAVVFFNVETHWWKKEFSDNTKENVDELLAYANSLALEGATDLGAALAEGARPEWLPAANANAAAARWDMFLLGDGTATWGLASGHAILRAMASRGFAGSLFAYQTGMVGTDVAMLSQLTRETGGATFTVTGESEVEKAVTAHRARPWQINEVRVKGGADVLLAGRPKVLFPGQTLVAVGRGALGPDAEVELALSRDQDKRVVKTKLGTRIPSNLATRTYGQIATGTLEELGDLTEKISTAYATHFRVTGKSCSLLMLESEADYQRFNIKPDEDAFVIKQTPVAAHIAKVLAELGSTLGDPKASFVTLLKNLEKTPGVTFRTPASYSSVIESLPSSSFAVELPTLVAKAHDKKSLPAPIATQLEKHALDYDALSLESASRAKQLGPPDALRAISSLVEESPGDAVLARDVAYSALALGLHGQAYQLMTRVAAKRPFEPQTYRALGQILAAMGKNDLALAYFEIALIGQWDSRFGEFPEIVRFDYLRFLKKVSTDPKATSVPDYVRARLETLGKEVKLSRADIVVMITWNTDATDVDLHVKEPSGEECFYSHPSTAMGGQLTRDVTRGYGPEMYVLPKAKAGTYAVSAHYFASDRNRASARTKVYVTVVEGWGTPQERVTERVVTLEIGKQVHDIITLRR